MYYFYIKENKIILQTINDTAPGTFLYAGWTEHTVCFWKWPFTAQGHFSLRIMEPYANLQPDLVQVQEICFSCFALRRPPAWQLRGIQLRALWENMPLPQVTLATLDSEKTVAQQSQTQQHVVFVAQADVCKGRVLPQAIPTINSFNPYHNPRRQADPVSSIYKTKRTERNSFTQ